MVHEGSRGEWSVRHPRPGRRDDRGGVTLAVAAVVACGCLLAAGLAAGSRLRQSAASAGAARPHPGATTTAATPALPPVRRGLVTVLSGVTATATSTSAPPPPAPDPLGRALAVPVPPLADPPAAPAPVAGGSSAAPIRSTTTRPPGRTTTTVVRYAAVSGVGDSVMLGATVPLTAAVAAATGGVLTVDARVGRQFTEGVTVVGGLATAGSLGDAVIVHLGTNGPVTAPSVRSLLDQLTKVRTVLLVNVRVPKTWEAGVNATLASVGATYPNVHLVDWHAATEGHPELLAADGVHPVPAGSAAYAALLAAALASA